MHFNLNKVDSNNPLTEAWCRKAGVFTISEVPLILLLNIQLSMTLRLLLHFNSTDMLM